MTIVYYPVTSFIAEIIITVVYFCVNLVHRGKGRLLERHRDSRLPLTRPQSHLDTHHIKPNRRFHNPVPKFHKNAIQFVLRPVSAAKYGYTLPLTHTVFGE